MKSPRLEKKTRSQLQVKVNLLPQDLTLYETLKLNQSEIHVGDTHLGENPTGVNQRREIRARS